MKSSHLFLPFAWMALLLSCNQPNQVATSDDKDLTMAMELLDRQGKLLLGKNCQKTAHIHSKQEQQTIVIDSTFFKTDLTILTEDLATVFGQLTYQKTISSDSKTISYATKEPAINGPTLLKIGKDERGAILTLEIEEEKANYLHQTHLNMGITFDPAKGIMKSYHIKGEQQIIGMDAIPFEVIGLID